MMKMKRLALLIALAFLTQSLGGCVYQRLLKVKSQLSDFDKYMRLEDKEGLDLIFLEPILFKKDILYLARRGPTTIQESPQSSIWRFYFQKRREGKNQSEEKFDVPVDLFFESETLTMVRIPRRFIQILPRRFIVESFKAIGRAEVNPGKRYASGTLPEKKEGGGIPIPSKTDLLRLLGIPTEERRSSPVLAMNYIYVLRPAKPELEESPPEAWASFEFHGQTQRLIKAEARFAGIKLSMTFEN